MACYLRAAEREDMDLLFEWANEPLVRKHSFSDKEITYEEHKKWFQALLNDPNRRQYIYMKEEQPIGQVRMELDGETAKIGYSICAGMRGKGYGTLLLREACVCARRDFPDIRTFVGEVKPENRASKRAFFKAGFYEKKYTYEVSADQFDADCQGF